MSIRTLKRWALLLTFWVAIQGKYLRATPITGDTVSGNFTATGTADIQGATLSLGMRSDNSNPGWAASYTDGSNAYVDFLLSRSSGTWRWSQNAGSTSKLQLKLDNNNKLILFDQSSTPVAKITLDPLGTSTFANSVTLNGTDNEMPNQTLVNSNSVLTEGLGDSRYAPLSSFSIAAISYAGATTPAMGLVGGSATGPYSVAIGREATASGAFSSAIGRGATASGAYSSAIGRWATASGAYSSAIGQTARATGNRSFAMGYATHASGWGSTASGFYSIASGYISTAFGHNTIASGGYSTAIGSLTTASGSYSTAMGEYTIASGNVSTASGLYTTASGIASMAMGSYANASGMDATAFGFGTTAQAYGSVAIGSHNVGGGTSNSWVPTDPLFEVGNGTASGYYPPTTISGYYTSSGSYVRWVYIPAYWTYTSSDALVVYKNGDAAVQGTLTMGSDVTSGGAITAAGSITAGDTVHAVNDVSAGGNVNAVGAVTAGGTVTAPTFITTAPTGDIPMFTGN